MRNYASRALASGPSHVSFMESDMNILAIDLGLTKSVACLLSTQTNEHTFRTVPTNPEAFRQLIVETRAERVVFEVCTIGGWVRDLCEELGCPFEVANPSHEAWRWRNVKRKSDRLDALKLARLSAMAQLPKVHVPARDVREWRSLISYRHTLVRRRTRVKNHIRAVLIAHGIRLGSGMRGWTRETLDRLRMMASQAEPSAMWKFELGIELDQLDALATAITRTEERLDAIAGGRPGVALLRTIPGVGARLAELVVAMIDDPRRFPSSREVASYAGLTPTQYQSGDADRRGRISRQGNPLLRAMLVEVSWIGLRYNPTIRALYERTCRKSMSRRKIAIVAVARHLLVWAWAMLRNGTPWTPRPRQGVVTTG